MIFGWGPRRKTYQLDQTHLLILNYQIFHIMWLFQVAWNLQYSIATATQAGWATRRLTPEEVQSLQAERLLSLNTWWRWGLAILGGIVGLGIIFSMVMGIVSNV